jgi:hypothetical protein
LRAEFVTERKINLRRFQNPKAAASVGKIGKLRKASVGQLMMAELHAIVIEFPDHGSNFAAK